MSLIKRGTFIEETFKFIKDVFPSELENLMRSTTEGEFSGRNYFVIFIRCFLECVELCMQELLLETGTG